MVEIGGKKRPPKTHNLTPQDIVLGAGKQQNKEYLLKKVCKYSVKKQKRKQKQKKTESLWYLNQGGKPLLQTVAASNTGPPLF